MSKNSPAYLTRLENIFKEAGFQLRYEKGNFKSGQCVLEDRKIVVINKFSALDTKIAFLVSAIQSVNLDVSEMEDKSLALYNTIRQTEIKF